MLTPKSEGASLSPARKGAAILAVGAACAACCALPFALPAAALAMGGGGVAWLTRDGAGFAWLGAAAVPAAWTWVGVRTLRTRRRPARATLYVLGGASVAVAMALIC